MTHCIEPDYITSTNPKENISLNMSATADMTRISKSSVCTEQMSAVTCTDIISFHFFM